MTQYAIEITPAVEAVSAEVREQAAKMMRKAIMHLVLNDPFYGSLLLKLKVGEDRRGHPSIWTDGFVLRYNPAFIVGRTFEDLVFILKHEVTHNALLHPFRGAKMEDHDVANQAADHAVNLVLKREGAGVPADALCDDRFEGMFFETIYQVLMSEKRAQQKQEQPKQSPDQDGEGEGEGSGGSSGESDSSDEPEASESEQSEPSESSDGEQDGESDQQEDGEGDSTDSTEQDADDEVEQSAGSADDESDEGESSQSESDAAAQPEQLQDSDGNQEQSNESSLADSPGTKHGDFMPAGESASEEGETMSEAQREEAQREWEAAVASAVMQAEQAGHLSANAARSLREGLKPPQSYVEHLRMFASSFVKEETSWKRPSKRSSAVYLPSNRTEAVGKLVIGIDTSGSVDDEQLGQMEKELAQVHADLRPEELIVLYIDDGICGEERIGRFDEVRFVRPQGGGGTSFIPAFNRVEELLGEGEDIVGVIYLTDMYGDFPAEAPDYPVLWVSTSSKRNAPFGEVACMMDR